MTGYQDVTVYGHVDGKHWVTDALVQCGCGMGAIELDVAVPTCSNCGALWSELNRPGFLEDARALRDRAKAKKVYQPVTVVDDETHCPTEVLIERIQRSRRENGDLLQRYHDLWYESGHTWHYTHFLGVGMMKCPNDIWMYQDLMTKLRPQVVIETGTYQGGSALWFAFLMDMLRIEGGRVLTVDIKDYRKTWMVEHPRIVFLDGNSADPEVAVTIEEALPEEGPRLVVLDSDHSAEHVYNELALYAPMLRVGDWLVVEDTNIGWEGEPGARGGMQRYMDQHPGEFVQDVLSERYLLTMNPGGWMQRVRACEHA